MKTVSHIIGFASTLLLALSSQVHALPSYSVVDLGMGSNSAALGINNLGQVVGVDWATDGTNTTRAFYYSGSGSAYLGTLGGSGSDARSINDTGQIAGSAQTGNGAYWHAVRYSNGGITDLGTLGGSSSSGLGIDQTGRVVGSAQINDNPMIRHGFSSLNGQMTDLGGPNGMGLDSATAISDNGIIAGYGIVPGKIQGSYVNHAFRYSNGQLFDLGELGGEQSKAYGVNNRGQVVGETITHDNRHYAFLYNDTMDFSYLYEDGELGSVAEGINNLGDVVGYSMRAEHVAFLWKDGSRTDLNDLIDPTSSWIIRDAHDINDSGQIAATGCQPGSGCRAIRLDPTTSSALPEPGTMQLFGITMCVALLLRRLWVKTVSPLV